MELKNYDELVEELADIRRMLDKEIRNYETDVLFYYNPKTQIGELDTFENRSGNSWVNDGSVVIYTMKPWFDDIFQVYYEDKQMIADVLDITTDQLIEETYKWRGWNKDHYDLSDVEDSDIIEYCESRDDYMDLLQAGYESSIDNSDYQYESEAQRILDDAIVEYGDRWEIKSEDEEALMDANDSDAPAIDDEIEF